MSEPIAAYVLPFLLYRLSVLAILPDANVAMLDPVAAVLHDPLYKQTYPPGLAVLQESSVVLAKALKGSVNAVF